jgi:hypothetical protein
MAHSSVKLPEARYNQSLVIFIGHIKLEEMYSISLLWNRNIDTFVKSSKLILPLPNFCYISSGAVWVYND